MPQIFSLHDPREPEDVEGEDDYAIGDEPEYEDDLLDLDFDYSYYDVIPYDIEYGDQEDYWL